MKCSSPSFCLSLRYVIMIKLQSILAEAHHLAPGLRRQILDVSSCLSPHPMQKRAQSFAPYLGTVKAYSSFQ